VRRMLAGISRFVLKHVHYLPLAFDPALTLQPWWGRAEHNLHSIDPKP
jgi:hypothetical protein